MWPSTVVPQDSVPPLETDVTGPTLVILNGVLPYTQPQHDTSPLR